MRPWASTGVKLGSEIAPTRAPLSRLGQPKRGCELLRLRIIEMTSDGDLRVALD